MRLVLGQDGAQVRSPRTSTRSRSSRRRVPTSRSQIAFMRGAWTAVRRIRVPAGWKTASNEAVKFGPWSRMRNLMSSKRSPKLKARLRAAVPSTRPSGSR